MISLARLSGSLHCLIFVQALLILSTGQAFARQDVVPGSRYTSARAAALGDAFMPLGDDGASALFNNPAAVGKIRKFQAEPMNLGLMANGGFTDSMGLDSYKIYSLSGNLPKLSASPGAYQGGGISILPNIAGPGFAVGVLMQNEFGASADAAGNVHYRSLYQFIPAAAFGLRLAGGIVRIGYSLQWVNEAVGDVTAPAGTDPLGYNQGLPQGSGFSHTMGFALTLPIAFLPSINIVGRNLLGTPFNMRSIVPIAASSPGAPATEPMSVDASFSVQPKIDSGIYSNVSLVYRDATNSSSDAPLGRLALGTELSFRDFLFLRGGFGGGYPSAGLGLRMKRGEFSFAWYSTEVGGSLYAQRDIRYMLQFMVRSF
jgi:hypothetical protein